MHWGESKAKPDIEGDIWSESWFTDLTFSRFKVNEWRCCVAKYDGVPYFLLIISFIMFRFGKSGYWE